MIGRGTLKGLSHTLHSAKSLLVVYFQIRTVINSHPLPSVVPIYGVAERSA